MDPAESNHNLNMENEPPLEEREGDQNPDEHVSDEDEDVVDEINWTSDDNEGSSDKAQGEDSSDAEDEIFVDIFEHFELLNIDAHLLLLDHILSIIQLSSVHLTPAAPVAGQQEDDQEDAPDNE